MLANWERKYCDLGAIAPLDEVRKSLEVALKVLPENKIMMGIPNFGFDWELPFDNGITRTRTFGNMEATEVATKNRTVIQYSEAAQSPYFTYIKDNVKHEVWFDDLLSISAKSELAREFGLCGIVY